MTIPHNSKSYPYLAIAHEFNVDYGRVLLYSEKLVRVGVGELAPFTNWRYEIWRLEKDKLKIGVDI